MMNVDWLNLLNIFRIIFAVIILFFSSYLDIKAREVGNYLWLVFGLVAISILECEVIIAYGYQAFEHLVAVVPLTILFMSFLVCEYIYDLEEKKINEPWIFSIALVAFIFFYLIIIDPAENFKSLSSGFNLLVPIGLFLLFFIFIQSFLNYSFYRAYASYKEIKEKKQELKTNKKRNKEDVEIDNINIIETDSPDEIIDQKISWFMFFALTVFVLISIIMSEIVKFNEGRIVGLVIMVLIPIFIVLKYGQYYYQMSNDVNRKQIGQRSKDPQKKGSKELEKESDFEYPFDDPDFKPPNQVIIYFLFIGLILFGFVIIIYYSISEEISDIIKITFISIIWIIILYAFYNLGIPRGGADTKALMAMVILFPGYIIIENITLDTDFFKLIDQFPATADAFPVMFSTLLNAAFIMLFFVIAMLFFNLFKRNVKFPNSLLGYKMHIDEIPKKFVWLMERNIDGEMTFEAFPKDTTNLKDELEAFRKQKIFYVWVTPKIPFLIPITLGFIFTLLVGNFIFILIGFFI
jgi:preflagellin peptidase FlaK